MADLRLQSGQRLVFAGDSNTDTEYRGRARPLGYGYVMMVDAFLRASHPRLAFEVENRGNDGDTVIDLERRWDEDVLSLRPDWLFVMIGTNDVGYREVPEYRPRAVDDATFERTLSELVRRPQRARVARVALIEPPPFELPLESAPNRDMKALGPILARIAAATGCERVPVWEGMSAALASGGATGWFQNVNHPSFPGHAFLALQVLRLLGWEPPR